MKFLDTNVIISFLTSIYAEHRNLGFEDALAITHMQHQGIAEIISYDRDCGRVPGIQRFEPQSAD